VAGAFGWGVVAASSLVIGALLGIARTWPDRVVGLVLAFGGGALISAVSFELAGEGIKDAGTRPVAIGLALGALTYFHQRLCGRRVAGHAHRLDDPRRDEEVGPGRGPRRRLWVRARDRALGVDCLSMAGREELR
jgi:ZIP family zinc transporter